MNAILYLQICAQLNKVRTNIKMFPAVYQNDAVHN